MEGFVAMKHDEREEAMRKKLIERMADELSWWDLIKVSFWRLMR